MVNSVLGDMINRFVFVYLNDILIFSPSLQVHTQHVRQVLQRLLENQLFVKAEKCEFHAKSVSFLGFIVSAGEIKPDPAKVEAVAKWPVPDTRKALQRFLGFANFYRRFIRNFGQVAAPLTALTSIKVPFTWSAQAQEAFDKLKVPVYLCSCSLHSRSRTAIYCWGGRLWCRGRRSLVPAFS